MLSPLRGTVPDLSRIGSNPDRRRNRANVRPSPQLWRGGAARRVRNPVDASRAVEPGRRCVLAHAGWQAGFVCGTVV